MIMVRITKEEYYLNIAREVSRRSTCIRRRYGAVIVKKDQIISTGYGGAPRRTINCIDIGVCARDQLHIPHGEKYEICRGVHAEQNAIIHSSRLEMMGSKLFLVGVDVSTGEVVENSEPCKICKRMIINAGIKVVFILRPKQQIIKIVVREWEENNMDELKKVDGRWEPILKPGYQ
jgi:dCMP deaminase